MSECKFKLYTASAGSGKTYTLVKEFLTLSMRSENASCKDILAVTFTNKAANEMKEKILFYLGGFVRGKGKDYKDMKADIIKALNIDEETLHRRAKVLYDNILHNYSDFNISTIDSFIQQVSRSFAKELNLPVQYKVLIDDDDLLDGLIQSIDSQIGEDSESITEILSDFVDFQLDEESSSTIDGSIKVFVQKLLKESAYKRGEMLNIEDFDDKEYADTKEALKKLYDNCKSQVFSSVNAIRTVEDNCGIVSEDYFYGKTGLQSVVNKIEKDIDDVSSLVGARVSLVLNRGKDWFSAKGNKDAIARVNQSVNLVDMYKTLLDNYNKYFGVNIIRKNLYLYALRGTLLRTINQYVDETNKVHLSEFNKRISDILGDCSVPFIYEKIGSRYKHFFIDEFQDTSLLQWHNFLPLVNNGISENNMSLLVGDAKQAIYRFRNGEVEQIMNLPEIYGADDSDFYAECEENFKGMQKESLDSNYRSKRNIIEFNNSFFRLSKHKLKSEYYRKVYDGLEQKCPRQYPYDGFVSVEAFDMEKFTATDTDGVSKQYKEAVKKSMLSDIEMLKGKGFSYRDIAILVRNNDDGYDIAEFMSENGIPIISSESILLKSSDKVELVIYTLRCMVDDKNDTNKLALSFYNNVCSGESCDISKALSDDVDFNKIYDLRNQAYSLYDLCCTIIKEHNLNIVDDVFLQYFMNHVFEWQNAENKGVEAFLEHWDKKSDSLKVMITSEIDAVQIMTVHKSKGLEFKVVMFPYAYTTVQGTFKGSEKWLSSKEFEVLKDINGISNFILPINKKLLDTNLESHYTEEIDKTAFDAFNIMYVAMTRPKDLMFIYTKYEQKTNDKKFESYNLFVDYFEIDDVDRLYFSVTGEAILVEDEDMELIRDRFKKTVLDNQNSIKFELGEIKYYKKEEKEEDDDDEKKKPKEILELDSEDMPKPLRKWADVLKFDMDPTMFCVDTTGGEGYEPREWGNLVHEILSKINTIEDSQKVLNVYINDGSIDQEQAEMLQRQFDDIVNRPELKDAYSKEAVVRNEMDILAYNSKENKNDILRPDRYVEYGGRLILIDYKTGKEDEKKHENQLQEYIAALRGMGVKKDIEAYLVYISKANENVDVKPVP